MAFGADQLPGHAAWLLTHPERLLSTACSRHVLRPQGGASPPLPTIGLDVEWDGDALSLNLHQDGDALTPKLDRIQICTGMGMHQIQICIRMGMHQVWIYTASRFVPRQGCTKSKFAQEPNLHQNRDALTPNLHRDGDSPPNSPSPRSKFAPSRCPIASPTIIWTNALDATVPVVLPRANPDPARTSADAAPPPSPPKPQGSPPAPTVRCCRVMLKVALKVTPVFPTVPLTTWELSFPWCSSMALLSNSL